MAEAVEFCKVLENEIVKASEAEALNRIRQKLTDFESAEETGFDCLANYEKQRAVDAVAKVRKLIETKKSALGRKPFVFKGAPLLKPQVHSVDHQPGESTIEPTIKGLVNWKHTVQSLVNHMYVEDIHNCILINEYQSNLVTINGGDSCIAILSTTGTVHITGFENSVLIVGCHQLRIHKSSNCKIIAKISTTVIIENCHDMIFSQNVKVDDFDWQFAAQSSNYTLQPLTASGYLWVYNVADGSLGSDTCDILKAINRT